MRNNIFTAIGLVGLLGGCVVGEAGTVLGGGDGDGDGSGDGDGDGGGGGGGGGGDNPTPTLAQIRAGSFTAFPPYTAMFGRAQLVNRLDGATEMSMSISGLVPNGNYVAHVHNQPCALGQAGGHYKKDPAVAEVVAANELWFTMTSDADGLAHSTVLEQHAARGEALSVVIHDPLTTPPAKMACADLLSNPNADFTATGPMTPLAGVEPQDQAISGTASLTVTASGTTATLNLTGLTDGIEYGSHVHAEPCEVGQGGGHYKLDPTVVEVIEANEVWPAITRGVGGAATATITTTHRVRGDAQSIVLHRTVTPDSKPKIVCANLVRTHQAVLTRGNGIVLPDAAAAGVGGVTSQATMTRDLAGRTKLELSATGLTPNMPFVAHVHDQPCNVKAGGGHYKLDRAVADVIDTNEMWVTLDAGADGTASQTEMFTALARADAQSVVIHEPVNAKRISCIDLQ